MLAAFLVGTAAGPVQAQPLPIWSPGVNPNAPFYNRINPLYRVGPGLTQQQALYNWVQTGRAFASVPPWVYNPNILNPPIIAPVPPWMPAPLPASFYPPLGNIYTPTPGAATLDPSNPYSSVAPGFDPNAYYPNYYYYDPYGGALRGVADLTRAQGTLMMNREMANVLRERANQEKLKTKKEAFDLERYMRENAITYTEEQARIAAKRLQRVQTMATAGEIQSGNAANLLLEDLSRHRDKRVSVPPIPLEENELRLLNIGIKDAGNIALLREEGRFTWPGVLVQMVNKDTRRHIEILAQDLVQQAANGNVNQNQLRDLHAHIERLREQLAHRVNDYPTEERMEGKRFLNAFADAVTALRQPETVVAYFNYRKFVSGGKTIQEVVDYLNSRGLVINPALNSDTAAYRAFYAALASYNVAFHAQLASK